jgi:competence protein ComEA
MNFLRRIVRNTFGFSATEINGFLILLPLIFLVVSSEPLYRWWLGSREVDLRADQAFLDSLVQAWQARDSVTTLSGRASLLPSFDPNTASVDSMVAAGMPLHLATRTAAYRQKGGSFRVKSDLLRIYGVDSALYKQLSPRMVLPSSRKSYDSVLPAETRVMEARRQPQLFDINSADTLELQSVYGIGPRLALRILRFREALGGFVNSDQLYEVYGLDSAVVVRLINTSYISKDFSPEKIDINAANEEDLARHPYISKKMAQRIVAYRFHHGLYTDATALHDVFAVSGEELDRILPYIATGN